MATQTGTNVQIFPPQSAGASGPIVETAYMSDGTTTTTITPGSDGATPPGVPMTGNGVTLNPTPAAPVAQAVLE
jgi:hypothetical protein